MGRDQAELRAAVSEAKFQSTRPRGARLGDELALDYSYEVSIHAPAWGATLRLAAHAIVDLGVSIHAPAWGATTASRSG